MLEVPQYISTAGFDDTNIVRLADPDLTTVDMPQRQTGRRAASTPLQMVKQRKATAVSSF
jgi:DNA-binding LacI/PurR family transcriptional regulator